MIHKPFSKPGIGGYAHLDYKTDIPKFCYRKRKRDTVIFNDTLLPVKCAVCGKMIDKGQANRVDINPKLKLVTPMHYECAWNALFGVIYSLKGNTARVHGDGYYLVYENGKQLARIV